MSHVPFAWSSGEFPPGSVSPLWGEFLIQCGLCSQPNIKNQMSQAQEMSGRVGRGPLDPASSNKEDSIQPGQSFFRNTNLNLKRATVGIPGLSHV